MDAPLILSMARSHGVEIGELRGELRIVHATLNSLLPHVTGWPREELRDLVGRIDLALGRTT